MQGPRWTTALFAILLPLAVVNAAKKATTKNKCKVRNEGGGGSCKQIARFFRSTARAHFRPTISSTTKSDTRRGLRGAAKAFKSPPAAFRTATQDV